MYLAVPPARRINRASDWYRSQPKWKQAAYEVLGGGLGAMALWPEFDEDQPEGRPIGATGQTRYATGAGPSPTGRSGIQGGYRSKGYSRS